MTDHSEIKTYRKGDEVARLVDDPKLPRRKLELEMLLVANGWTEVSDDSQDEYGDDLRQSVADLRFNDEPGTSGALGANMESKYFEELVDFIVTELQEAVTNELKLLHQVATDEGLAETQFFLAGRLATKPKSPESEGAER